MLRQNEIISNVLLTIDQYKGKVLNLRNAIIDDEFYRSSHFSRLLIWKVCLITDTLNISKWDEALNGTRVVYGELMKRSDMVVPWEKLDEDSVFYRKQKSRTSSSHHSGVSGKTLKNVIERQQIDDDPLSNRLSLALTLPLVSDVDLLVQITLDIERIFPGNEFFHASTPIALHHKTSLIEILYIWSKCNPNIGYKQGLHEIIGLIYFNLCKESIEIPNTNAISVDDHRILKLYNSKFLAHDTFTIFNKFINQSGIAGRFYEQESALFDSIQHFNINLLKVDQLIHYNLTSKLKLESQLWIIRYFRLLLSRELGNDLNIVMRLWEKLVAYSTNTVSKNGIPEILNFMIITLLIHIKADLIASDFSEALSILLHYPIDKVKQKYLGKTEFYQCLFKDSVQLYERKDKDLKLYEFGIKLNEAYNPNLKFKMSYNGRTPSLSPRPSQETIKKKEDKRELRDEQLKFEKLRLEMRLKKRAQEMVNK